MPSDAVWRAWNALDEVQAQLCYCPTNGALLECERYWREEYKRALAEDAETAPAA